MKSIDFLREHNVAVDQSLELFGDIETYKEIIQVAESINSLKKQICQTMQFLFTL